MPREALNKAFILTMLNRTFFGTVTEGALFGTMHGDSTLQLFREVASIRGECREAAGSTTLQKTFRDNAINRPQTTQILLYDRTYLSPCFRADEKGPFGNLRRKPVSQKVQIILQKDWSVVHCHVLGT